MGYYFSKVCWAFMYLILTMALGFGIMFVGPDNQTVMLIASLLNLALFTVAMVLVFFKEGKRSYHTLLENDLTRKRIIETGRDLPIKRAEEYGAHKGFMIGAFVCLPLVVLLIIHIIVSLTTGNNILGVISGILVVDNVISVINILGIVFYNIFIFF